jgi:hypothetical protein
MAKWSAGKKSFPLDLTSFLDELVGVPRSFLFGWLAGLLVPVISLAGIVSGIYFLTRKIPFITEVVELEGRRRLVVELVEPTEARVLLQRSRDAARAFRDEIRAETQFEI